MEDNELKPLELFQALLEHRVTIEYLPVQDELTVCPTEGRYQDICLIRLGMAQLLDAKIFLSKDGWRVEGLLRDFMQKNSVGFQKLKLSKAHKECELRLDPIRVVIAGTENSLESAAQLVVVKNRLFYVDE